MSSIQAFLIYDFQLEYMTLVRFCSRFRRVSKAYAGGSSRERFRQGLEIDGE